MNCIGFRAQPKRVDYVILSVEDDSASILSIGEIVVPVALGLPEQLAYVRVVIHDLLREFNIVAAGLRLFERVSENKSIPRVRLEAVIQESLAGSNAHVVFAGGLGMIAARVPGRATPTELKRLVEAGGHFDLVPAWDELRPEAREALLAALAAAGEQQ